MVILLQLGHYIVLDIKWEGEQMVNHNQDDKTTAKHLLITFILFLVLGVILVVGANMIA